MRRTIALVLTATTLALTGSVLTATAAEARNVGGTIPADAICLSPGSSEARSVRANDVLACFCFIAPLPEETPSVVGQRRNVGGNVPAGTNCPPGILGQAQRPDRNVGG